MALRKNPVDRRSHADQAAKMRASGYIPSTEVAEKMDVTLATVNRWCADGAVESELVAKKRYIRVDSLVEHIGVTQAIIFKFISEEKARKNSAEEREGS